jgi:osmotically-inducible protein OsmY
MGSLSTASTTDTSPTMNDESVQRNVLAELKWDARVSPNEIGVVVKNGIVTLTGRVDSYVKKWSAEEAAHRVRGVKAVANELEVKLPGSDERTDEDIAASAISSLKWNVSLAADDIELTVSKGWVTLKGDVEWNYQKTEAERVVRNLRGVKGVTNLLTVKPRVRPDELKEKIENALIRSAKTDARNITVEVEGSKVILKGRVRSFSEKEDAERAAWLAPGVSSVDSRITVSYV